MKNVVSSQDYVKNPTACPVCKNGYLEGSDVGVDFGEATQDIWCVDCGATWTDVYQLVGYRFLEVPATEHTPICGKCGGTAGNQNDAGCSDCGSDDWIQLEDFFDHNDHDLRVAQWAKLVSLARMKGGQL
jgi:hypothetical protein